MKIVKCDICGKNKKTYSNTGFVCCSTKQAIDEHNWVNKPRKEPTTNNKSLEVENIPVIEKTEVQELTAEDKVDTETLPTLENTPTEENLEIEEEQEYSEEDYKYKCSFCGSLFDELNEGHCPNSQCDADLTPYL